MSVTHLGSKSVGAINIGVSTIALPQLSALLADLLSRIAALQGQVTANLALIATLPDPAAMAAAIAAAAAAAVSQIAAIITSIPAPLVSANVTLGVDLAGLQSLLVALQLAVDTLTAAVSAGGVHAFRVDSTAAAVAGELSALTSGGMPGGGLPGARVYGVVLLTESPAAFSALSTVLLTA
jgi:hypothetical protein